MILMNKFESRISQLTAISRYKSKWGFGPNFLATEHFAFKICISNNSHSLGIQIANGIVLSLCLIYYIQKCFIQNVYFQMDEETQMPWIEYCVCYIYREQMLKSMYHIGMALATSLPQQTLKRSFFRRLPKSKSNVPINKAYGFTGLYISQFSPEKRLNFGFITFICLLCFSSV